MNDAVDAYLWCHGEVNPSVTVREAVSRYCSTFVSRSGLSVTLSTAAFA